MDYRHSRPLEPPFLQVTEHRLHQLRRKDSTMYSQHAHPALATALTLVLTGTSLIGLPTPADGAPLTYHSQKLGRSCTRWIKEPRTQTCRIYSPSMRTTLTVDLQLPLRPTAPHPARFRWHVAARAPGHAHAPRRWPCPRAQQHRCRICRTCRPHQRIYVDGLAQPHPYLRQKTHQVGNVLHPRTSQLSVAHLRYSPTPP